MTPELARRIVDDELLKGIHFSLHGLKETHEGITRVKNSFDRTLKGIESILTARVKGCGRRPEVTIACTISGGNLKEAAGLIQLAFRLQVDRISFGHASFMPPEIQRTHRQVMEGLGLASETGYDDLILGPPEIPAKREDVEAYIQPKLCVNL